MEQAFADLWSQLYSTEGLRSTVETGGIALMVLIIFAETGLLAGFFLPGDSLLVTAGVLSVANGGRPELFDPWGLCAALTAAAIVGDQAGYWLGRRYGDAMESRPDTWWYKRRHLDEAREFFVRHGVAAIVLARFVPVMRTFVPFAAGIGRMERRVFVLWNALGGVLWVWSLVWLGRLIGGTSLADKLHKVILIVVAVSLLPLVWTLLRRRLGR
ncbi:MAG: DedA family protein [Opitutales bacterium]